MSKQTKILSRKLTTTSAANASLATDSPWQSDKPPPTMDTAALIREVTQRFSDTMDEKLSKISKTLEKISSTLESQTKRITAAEQRISDAEDIVAGLEVRLAEAEEKIKAMSDSMDDQGRPLA